MQVKGPLAKAKTSLLFEGRQTRLGGLRLASLGCPGGHRRLVWLAPGRLWTRRAALLGALALLHGGPSGVALHGQHAPLRDVALPRPSPRRDLAPFTEPLKGLDHQLNLDQWPLYIALMSGGLIGLLVTWLQVKALSSHESRGWKSIGDQDRCRRLPSLAFTLPSGWWFADALFLEPKAQHLLGHSGVHEPTLSAHPADVSRPRSELQKKSCGGAPEASHLEKGPGKNKRHQKAL